MAPLEITTSAQESGRGKLAMSASYIVTLAKLARTVLSRAFCTIAGLRPRR